MATIDALLPVRNGALFLGESVDSIRAQTFCDWRLIILDHGSSDGSLELAQQYREKDRRIEVLSFPDADGLGDLLNAGLRKCDCKYLLRQDADDISFPSRMSVVNDHFSSNPDCLAVGSDAVLIDKAGRQIGYQPMPNKPLAITAAGFFYNPMLHPTITAKFSALKLYDASYGTDILHLVPLAESPRINGLAEDYILYGQLALLGSCANISFPLIKYRKHSSAVGAANPTRQTDLALQISRFLAKSFCLMKNVQEFDPGPFCNHGENVFDFRLRDYTEDFERMALALRGGLGLSAEVERELAFRWALATRNSGLMAVRYLQYHAKYGSTPSEWRTVRNWLARGFRKGKYVYTAKSEAIR